MSNVPAPSVKPFLKVIQDSLKIEFSNGHRLVSMMSYIHFQFIADLRGGLWGFA